MKQDGRIRNMVDDYKEEFNRKQLHIDALYDYIDKLQANKTDKNDLTTGTYFIGINFHRYKLSRG